ncbi:MAG: hypothetical protein, partial [Olavius algarvensis Gamma 1 endosymbiont]
YGPFATSASRSRLRLPRTTRLALRASLAGSVRTDFNARRAGVDVVAGAALIADKITEKGEKSAIRIDVT